MGPEPTGIRIGRACDAGTGESTAEIGALYVDPGGWRRRVGSALLAAGLDALAQVGFVEVTAWMLAGNSPGEAFYGSFGFELDGASKIHERSGATELRLRRPRPI